MGNSREDILKAIRANKPSVSAAKEIPSFPVPSGDLLPLFQEAVSKTGGELVMLTHDKNLKEAIWQKFPGIDPQYCIGPSEIMNAATKFSAVMDPHELEQLELAIFEGKIGVAENGAVWVSEEQLVHRAAPFITQHLVLLIKQDQLVWNMHQAYEILGNKLPDFGLFIAGPSKTADIEQSLVLGAHGPVSLTVFLLP